MKQLLNCVALLLFLSYAVSAQQQQQHSDKSRYAVVPLDRFLISVVAQPDCPVKFENIRMLARVGGGSGLDFQLRNVGNKPIRSVTFGWWTTYDTGSTGSWPGKITKELVMPGQVVPLSDGEDKDEEIPLTDELAKKMEIGQAAKAIVVLMVSEVKYADGTIYNNEAQYQGMRELLGKIGEKVDW